MLVVAFMLDPQLCVSTLYGFMFAYSLFMHHFSVCFLHDGQPTVMHGDADGDIMREGCLGRSHEDIAARPFSLGQFFPSTECVVPLSPHIFSKSPAKLQSERPR
jgi:hypothetical protein